MKYKLFFCAGLLFMCFGCGAKNTDLAAIKENYATATEISATVDVCANSGVIMDYSLAVTKKGDECATTVLMPEDISGITALIRGSSATVQYENAELEMLLPPLSGYTPIDCVDGILRSLAENSPQSYCYETRNEQECIMLEYETSHAEYEGAKKIWLNAASFEPVFAELYLDGARILGVAFKQFFIANVN